MMRQAPSSRKVTSSIFPLGAAAFGIAIFIADTLTHLEIAVAVLYVVVVLMAARFLQRRGVLLVSAGCVGLTLLSFFLSRPIGPAPTGVINTLVSILAIGLTVFLVRRSQTAEMVLREQASLLNLTHDTIFVRDMNDVITYWNRGAEELYGWKKEEAIGNVSHELMHTVFQVPLGEINDTLLRTDRWEGELIHTKRDGDKVLVASRWSLQRNERGSPLAILESNNDITERKRAEEGLQKTQAELAHTARVTTMGELTSTIAHEVNQPLAAIVTNGNACLRWLATNPPNVEEARETVTRMVKDGHRASEVVGRIRAFFRKTTPEKVRVDINQLIQDVIAMVPGELRRNRVQVRTELADDLPSVVGDQIQLQQVLLNLVINAIEGMSTVNRPRQLLIESQRSESGGVLVRVQDNGVGFDEQSAAQLFNAFYTTKPQGLGMGLSISRTTIEAYGGRLWATPNDGGGSTFQFTLPTSQENG